MNKNQASALLDTLRLHSANMNLHFVSFLCSLDRYAQPKSTYEILHPVDCQNNIHCKGLFDKTALQQLTLSIPPKFTGKRKSDAYFLYPLKHPIHDEIIRIEFVIRHEVTFCIFWAPMSPVIVGRLQVDPSEVDAIQVGSRLFAISGIIGAALPSAGIHKHLCSCFVSPNRKVKLLQLSIYRNMDHIMVNCDESNSLSDFIISSIRFFKK